MYFFKLKLVPTLLQQQSSGKTIKHGAYLKILSVFVGRIAVSLKLDIVNIVLI
jgi:hypothetical protein